jgi:predicted nucleotidyltransferase component of viral defense system
MKTISPTQLGAVVEADQLGLTDLDPSILEKDLLITEVLALLAGFDWGEVQPVFCGGTSLSKGYGLIQRMSEDIDFKLVLPDGWSRSQARRRLSDLRQRIAERMREADFALPNEGITTLNESRYFYFALGYTPQFPLVAALRAELRVDFTVQAPLLTPAPVQIRPLLAEVLPLEAQEVEHQAVAAAETMVEKVVSFLRRTACWPEQEERDPDDGQLVRHLYDVHQLLAVISTDPAARQVQQHLFNQTVAGDQQKFGRQDPLLGDDPRRRLAQALEQLQSSREIEELYERFVGELVWGPAVAFAEARDGFAALAADLLAGLDPPP